MDLPIFVLFFVVFFGFVLSTEFDLFCFFNVFFGEGFHGFIVTDSFLLAFTI